MKFRITSDVSLTLQRIGNNCRLAKMSLEQAFDTLVQYVWDGEDNQSDYFWNAFHKGTSTKMVDINNVEVVRPDTT